jgi:hypothetical protein
MLFAASSPLLAALRFQGVPEVLAQICTLGGIKPPSERPAVPSHENAAQLKHCVFCLGGAWQPPAADALAIIAPAAPDALKTPERDDIPALDLSALQPLSPRAPPRA